MRTARLYLLCHPSRVVSRNGALIYLSFMNDVSAEGRAKMRSDRAARVAVVVWVCLLAGVCRLAVRPAARRPRWRVCFRAVAVCAAMALFAAVCAAVPARAASEGTARVGLAATNPTPIISSGDLTFSEPYTGSQTAVTQFVTTTFPEMLGLPASPGLSAEVTAVEEQTSPALTAAGIATTPPPSFIGGSTTVSATSVTSSLPAADIPGPNDPSNPASPEAVLAASLGGLAGYLSMGWLCAQSMQSYTAAATTATSYALTESQEKICTALSTAAGAAVIGAITATWAGTTVSAAQWGQMFALTFSPVIGSPEGVAGAAALISWIGSKVLPGSWYNAIAAALNTAATVLGGIPPIVGLIAVFVRTAQALDTAAGWNPVGSALGLPTIDATGTIASSGGNGGLCADAYGAEGIPVLQQSVAVNTCNGSADQDWTVWSDGTVTNGGLCLTTSGATTPSNYKAYVPGNPLNLYTCNGSFYEHWDQEYSSFNAGSVYNPLSGFCIENPSGNASPGTPIQTWYCEGESFDAWALPGYGSSGTGSFPSVTGYGPIDPARECADAYSTSDGASPGQEVAINGCDGDQPQVWTVWSDGTVRAWNLCMDTSGSGDGALVELEECDGATSQVWEQQSNGTLLNSGSGLCLEDPGDNTTAGTQFDLDVCDGATDEQWALPGSPPDQVTPPSTWTGQVIADPAYIDPASDSKDWSTLIGSPTSKLGVVVANVLNGPGSTAVPAWASVINGAHASGKKVLGYVDTGYLGQTGRTTRLGSTAIADWVAQIEQDINAWYTLYGNAMDGIFFDDGYNVCGAGNEFPDVYDIVNQYEKVNHPGSMTVLNPGTAVPQCYEGTADVLLTFEGSEATYESSAYQPLGWTPKSPSEIWHIIYGVTASEVSLVDETSQTRGAGYVYMTDDVPANPYDTIPSFWSAEEADVPGGTPYAAAATPYTTGGALPTAPSGLSVTSHDYTSAALTWTGGAEDANYLIYLNGQEVASLPSSMTATTIGGLTPGGTAYTLEVVAQGADGDLSAASNSVGVTTLALPGGKAIAKPIVAAGASTISVSADFYVPYSFRRVYFSPPSTSTESCWWMADDNPIGDPLCARWLIENTTLLVYAGSGSDWTWTPVAYIPPTINGYTYTWTIPEADLGDYTGYIGFEGQGYGPFTDIYTAECIDCY